MTTDQINKINSEHYSKEENIKRLQADNTKINHPNHYNTGDIEVISAIEDWRLGFHLGNVIKYVARAGKKDRATRVEDLKKARFYLDRKIDLLETKKRYFR